VHRRGLEPLTTRFEAGYSIRLSYRCFGKGCIVADPLILQQTLFEVSIQLFDYRQLSTLSKRVKRAFREHEYGRALD
jgi:hypothetical protein